MTYFNQIHLIRTTPEKPDTLPQASLWYISLFFPLSFLFLSSFVFFSPKNVPGRHFQYRTFCVSSFLTLCLHRGPSHASNLYKLYFCVSRIQSSDLIGEGFWFYTFSSRFAIKLPNLVWYVRNGPVVVFSFFIYFFPILLLHGIALPTGAWYY